MNDDNTPGGLDGGSPGQQGLRLLALLTVIAGVLVLAAAAFVFSYTPVYDIARAAGIRPALARFYPALPDAVVVVSCAAALALRGARWWARWLVWLSIIALVALVGVADAVHAMAIKLPRRPTAAGVAVLPWVLLLLGFRLWLSVLRHSRKEQAPPASPAVAGAAADGVPADGVPADGVPADGVPADGVPAGTTAAGPSPAWPSPATPVRAGHPTAGTAVPGTSAAAADTAPADTATPDTATADVGTPDTATTDRLDLILPPYPDQASYPSSLGTDRPRDAEDRIVKDRDAEDRDAEERGGHSPEPFTADSDPRGWKLQPAGPASPLSAPVPERSVDPPAPAVRHPEQTQQEPPQADVGEIRSQLPKPTAPAGRAVQEPREPNSGEPQPGEPHDGAPEPTAEQETAGDFRRFRSSPIPPEE